MGGGAYIREGQEIKTFRVGGDRGSREHLGLKRRVRGQHP